MMGAPGQAMPAWHQRARAILTVVRFATGTARGPEARRLCAALISLSVAGCGGGSAPESAPQPETPPAAGCGNELAAVDLAGSCRAKPNATMGALEAVDS